MQIQSPLINPQTDNTVVSHTMSLYKKIEHWWNKIACENESMFENTIHLITVWCTVKVAGNVLAEGS